MTEFDPAPEPSATERRWQQDEDTFSRVYDVAMGITSPTPAAEIADIAGCSPNTAKKHLDRLVDMGIVSVTRTGRSTQYERNEGYLEWQDASRIANELTVEEIIERVGELEDERANYEEEFEATDPAAVSVYDDASHETIHDRMAAVSEWRGVIRDIRLYELARQLAENDGHLIPA
ncbi:winged helix-turn-helix domain-containing protein [Haloarcula halophila]|uniref:winged helix-turn-helix domain-containing protein n=1 Tax=Haloarcula TaxID=2237 RepID=UPI0023E3EE7B|nr:helix-turn-helix domain-containing protein [Halomicroarcula sp. DFY41]